MQQVSSDGKAMKHATLRGWAQIFWGAKFQNGVLIQRYYETLNCKDMRCVTGPSALHDEDNMFVTSKRIFITTV